MALKSSKSEDRCSRCQRERYVKGIASIAVEQNKKLDWSIARYAIQAVLWLITFILFYITYKREVICQRLSAQNTSISVVKEQ
ncbi:unnamed protein product [Bursaphelenchus xylophilus]|uniref:(pine wood nematode) hypothetical protein n=1 Tax=Bursaphelenchus xylophilus TaxID=6326 RepID=A0A1I7SM17_BURXY|nr:unnamed protein product [Bursaphelenchus xylophilus]CAG9129963.1 unnamed protein product [Bursaphelenchus xylophilus]